MRCNIIWSIILILFVHTGSKGQIIYGETLKDIDNNHIALQSFAGKKILFVVAPLTSDSLSNLLISYARNSPNAKIIGIMSEEDGYTNSKKNAVKSLYDGSGILLTQPLKTRNGAGQSPIMYWLSHKEKNTHFDRPATGIGYKFIISEKGGLLGALPEQVPFNSSGFTRIITANTN